MATMLFESKRFSAAEASGRIHSRRWTMPTASSAASPCLAGRIRVTSRNTRSTNRPPSIAKIFARAESGSIAASIAPVAVPRAPRQSAACEDAEAADAIDDVSSSPLPPPPPPPPPPSSASADSAKCSSIASVTIAKRLRRMPSHVSWLTRESIGAAAPSSPGTSYSEGFVFFAAGRFPSRPSLVASDPPAASTSSNSASSRTPSAASSSSSDCSYVE